MISDSMGDAAPAKPSRTITPDARTLRLRRWAFLAVGFVDYPALIIPFVFMFALCIWFGVILATAHSLVQSLLAGLLLAVLIAVNVVGLRRALRSSAGSESKWYGRQIGVAVDAAGFWLWVDGRRRRFHYSTYRRVRFVLGWACFYRSEDGVRQWFPSELFPESDRAQIRDSIARSRT